MWRGGEEGERVFLWCVEGGGGGEGCSCSEWRGERGVLVVSGGGGRRGRGVFL